MHLFMHFTKDSLEQANYEEMIITAHARAVKDYIINKNLTKTMKLQLLDRCITRLEKEAVVEE